ncbi:hypothetical protein MPH_03042 [Macrophomina phaseolina MS6]|uniref:Uncharacterized protein n=1 Tax=Macrophomina phaseolina (strain MS6) TaxID=1126212 RepID=K2RAZ3_MACPH|nr:hypothetical protein MPH_03042 [Macrophomina phaseolina MS6]
MAYFCLAEFTSWTYGILIGSLYFIVSFPTPPFILHSWLRGFSFECYLNRTLLSATYLTVTVMLHSLPCASTSKVPSLDVTIASHIELYLHSLTESLHDFVPPADGIGNRQSTPTSYFLSIPRAC